MWSRDARPRRMALVAYPDVQMLDVVGPLEVFACATRFLPPNVPGYAVEVLAGRRGPLRVSSGLTLGADRAWPQVRPHRRPRFSPDDLEAFLDELRAQRRARQPLGAQQDHVGRPMFVHSILRLAHMKHSFIGP